MPSVVVLEVGGVSAIHNFDISYNERSDTNALVVQPESRTPAHHAIETECEIRQSWIESVRPP